jgi:hypothetical protein
MPGLPFGLRYPGDRDFLLDEELRQVVNLHDFAGTLVFDK